jgi:hypothetical protein
LAKKIDAPAGIRPYVDLLLALTHNGTAKIARRVLTGGRALRKEAEMAGIVEAAQIRTNDDAIFLFQALQLVVRPAGIKAIVLLIDETEYIDALPPTQRPTVLDSLKHLWDQESQFFSSPKELKAAQLLMLFAATPNFWRQNMTQITQQANKGLTGIGVTPFFRRIIKANIIEMPSELSDADARKLIVNRMNEVRPGQKKEDIIPFTEDYVNFVYKNSHGLPRYILEICSIIIQEAAKRKLKKIDQADGAKILRDLLISYE